MSPAPQVPEKPSLDGVEQRWAARWETEGTYRFDRTKSRDEVYSIDTPPLTVSGSLHVGHVFSFTHTDTIARYQRMAGSEVFYPIGWDDNGLATERRVQNYFGVRCDPSLPYDADFVPPSEPPKDAIAISRPNFVELCRLLTQEDEKAFEEVWVRLGLSLDWSTQYTTIGPESQRASQRAFLRNLARDEAYQLEAPTLWDVDFQTAVAQAELEDREIPGAYFRLKFDDLEIDTTRPELIPACVAVVVHPDDARYADRVGTTVHTPLFGVEVPVMAHPLADPEKGTGIAMICTFGDVTDVTWWRELQLPVRAIVQRNGRIQEEPPEGVPDNAAWQELTGRTIKQAQKRIVELLVESGELIGEPRAITHPVKFYEKGDRPLEIVTSRQWYIRTMPHREAFLARGRELAWHPPYMLVRLENWIEGLTGDWCISRQRFFGVSFPVWYPVLADGTVDREHPILASEDMLPVDPSSDIPVGYSAEQRGQPGGFVGDPDVMDTWATSSLTPQIATKWEDDDDFFQRTFPMDLRPQAHEIIRTWLFSAIVRAEFEQGCLPWKHAAIAGWVLDPDRKKMSKSKGNVVTPMSILQEYGSDAVRYWAGSARPGVDTAFDLGQMKVGRRLAIKILNASKFVLARLGPEGEITEALDRAMLTKLADVVDAATRAFDEYDYARALERTESFFWSFCDDYLELVKGRAYGTQGDAAAASANAALTRALSTLLRLFAPFLPFVTEEVWSWWQEGSVHRSSWPDAPSLRDAAGAADAGALDVAADVLGAVRKAKSEARRSMRAEVSRAVVRDTPARLQSLATAADDVREAGRIAELVTEASDEPSVDVELAPEPTS